ncbi:MAG TPA: 30S ribosomal protein S13 [Patescibacteria group bacterium]|nr:30S ribosomal protein S13 [Patescibacteria group bacterium]
MVRMVGVNLPDDKRIAYALTLVYGVGFANGKVILRESQVDENKKVKDLTEEDLKRIQVIIEKKYKVEGDLKEEIRENIKRLKSIDTYRGVRHAHNLPLRGQRTKSNARTKRGKRKTVGALKKEDAVKVMNTATTKK